MAEEAIGRVKTVLVAPENRAIITTLIAHAERDASSPMLLFQGTVKFEKAVQRHLQETVLKHVCNITGSLKIPLNAFTLSAVNIGAASSSDIGISVNGFSGDVSVFLALLSSALQLPIRQDIVFTGHIGSFEGDILPVENLPAKCEACILDKSITQFVYPNLESELSLKRLKPREYETAIAAIRSCRGKLKLHQVVNTLELLQKAIEPEAMVLSSLRSDFFAGVSDPSPNSNLEPLITYFTQNNDKRLWDSLERAFLLKNVETGKELIKTFTKYYIERRKYPSNFGAYLSKLLVSLPPHIKKTSGLFPLLPKHLYIDLIQYVSDPDYEDMSLLHQALYGELKQSSIQPEPSKKQQRLSAHQKSLLSHILDQLNPDHIESKITRPYDEARASYAMDMITVESNAEFVDAITAFYAHIFRHINETGKVLDTDKLSGEALDVLKKTFHQKHGYNEALSEAKEGTRGGLRYILDRMTEYLKNEARQRHILKTFKENIDPLDFDARTAIIAEILKRKEEDLPEEITSQKPERFAVDYEEIVTAYVQSKVSLQNVFRRL